MTPRQKLYREYLHSDAWKLKADQCRAAAGFRCQVVWNGARCRQRATQCHHVRYGRLFHEPPEDLMAVCADCHRRLHHVLKIVANDNQLPLAFDDVARNPVRWSQ